MDYFDILLAKKLSGGGGGEITVEGLNVEENGTYTAPSGKAYSPVVVALPLDEKTITANGEYLASADDLKGFSKVTVNVAGFSKKAMPTGAISSFNDGTANPLTKLKIAINPVQAGSGDPSPSNPRPISGWTGANIHVADGETPHIIDNVVNIIWQTEAGTVYGGELDVTSGVLTVTKVSKKLNEFTWSYYSQSSYFRTTDLSSSEYTNTETPMAENYNPVPLLSASSPNLSIGWAGARLAVKDSDYSDPTLWLADVGEYKIVLTLKEEEQLTYQLTPTQVRSILGTNNIGADTGDILEGEYFVAL